MNPVLSLSSPSLSVPSALCTGPPPTHNSVGGSGSGNTNSDKQQITLSLLACCLLAACLLCSHSMAHVIYTSVRLFGVRKKELPFFVEPVLYVECDMCGRQVTCVGVM